MKLRSIGTALRAVLLGTMVFTLSACGGGGGSSSDGGTASPATGGNSPPTAPNPSPTQPGSPSSPNVPGVGAATLSWTPPNFNTDGSSLNNLAGYRVLYGTAPNELFQSIEIDNPSINTYMVEGLSGGTWYFAVVAVNGDGASSSPTNVVEKTVS